MGIKFWFRNIEKCLSKNISFKLTDRKDRSGCSYKDASGVSSEVEIRMQKYYNDKLKVIENQSINRTSDSIIAVGYCSEEYGCSWENLYLYLLCIKRSTDDRWIEIYKHRYGESIDVFDRRDCLHSHMMDEVDNLVLLSEKEKNQIALLAAGNFVAERVFNSYLKETGHAYKKIR